MICVTCKESMIAMELCNIEIDHCLTCGGVWLDHGELEMLFEDQATAKKFLETAAQGNGDVKSARKCPICDKKMALFHIGDDRKTEIDACRHGHGLWFDRGELETVAAHLEKGSAGNLTAILRDIFGK